MVGSYEHPLAYAILQVNTANPARTLISISINADFHKSQFNSIFLMFCSWSSCTFLLYSIAVKSLAIHTLAQCPKFSRADNQHTDHQKKCIRKECGSEWKKTPKWIWINLNIFHFICEFLICFSLPYSACISCKVTFRNSIYIYATRRSPIETAKLIWEISLSIS